MKAFWNLTLIPECNYFEKKLEEEFFTRFGIKMNAEFDTSELWEMQADEEMLSNRLRMDVTAGVMTINEARELRGMDPVEWGDTWWKSMGLVDVLEEPEPVPDALTQFAGRNNPQGEENPVNEAPPEDGPPKSPPKEEAPKSVHSLFTKGRMLYTPQYRDYRWKTQFDPIEPIEAKYVKNLKNLFYKMRQAQLHSLMEYGGQAAIQNSALAAMQDEPMWSSYNKDLKAITRTALTMGVEVTGNELLNLFGELGLDVGIGWDIFDTHAKDFLEYRINKIEQVTATQKLGIEKEINSAIENGWSVDETADALRERWNIAQNRAPTIARTEMAGAINDSRIAAFKEEGFQKHMWITARDLDVRGNDPNDKYDHLQCEAEVQPFGQLFRCGLTQPHDPAGEAGNVINCRCDSLPVFDEKEVGETIYTAPVVEVKESAQPIEHEKPKDTAVNITVNAEGRVQLITTKRNITIRRDEKGQMLGAEIIDEPMETNDGT